jgi:hypothetical protein
MGVKIDETRAGNENEAEIDEDQSNETEQEHEDQVESDEGADEAEEKAEKDGEPDELTLVIGEETQPEEDDRKAPDWVRELRKSDREKTRRIRELEQQLKTQNPAATAPRLGPRPKLEDYDFDTDKFDAAVDQWLEQKAKVDRIEREREDAEKRQRDEWQSRLDAYEKRKRELSLPDVDEAEESAKGVLSEIQQAIIVDATQSPELVMYALGKHPAKLQEFASMQNPARFAVAIGRLEASLKLTSKKPAPPAPEKVVRSGGSASSASLDNNLEKLRQEAERTGNYSKVIAYRKQKKAQ